MSKNSDNLLFIARTLPQILVSLAICLILTSCGGGSDNSDGGAELQTNACGTIGLGTRVINGATCSEQSSPIVEITLFSSNGSISLCSGSLLTSTHVLTAAHCFFDNIIQATVEVDGRLVQASRFDSHPNTIITGGIAPVFNDVAILTLASPLTGQPTLPIIVSQSIQSGDVFGVFGFGIDENDQLGELQSGQMRARDVSDNHIIAFFDGSGSNSCNGDSGGPAIFTTSAGRTGIVGIVSSGTESDCGAGDNSVYANVQGQSILDFITQTVPNARLE